MGAGVLLLFPFVLAAQRGALLTLPLRYPALMLVLLLFAAFAASNVAYFGTHEVWSFPLPEFFDKITGTFRSSGRFFWPVGYALLFATLAALLNKRSTAVLLLMAIAIPLQWADVRLLRERIMAKASAPSTGDLEPWMAVMRSVEKINLYPAFGCGEADVNLYWFFQHLAAKYGKLLDTGYIARPNVDCAGNTLAFSKKFAKEQLYVMPAEYLPNPFIVPGGFRDASIRGECVKWRSAVLCQAGSSPAYWAQSGLVADSLAPLKAHEEWSAEKLRTQIGKLQDGRLVPAVADKPGFLSFGPYIALPSGRYHYTIEYASRSLPSQQVGRWDIVMNSSTGVKREIAAGQLYGTDGATTRVEGVFETDGAKEPMEIRTHFAGSGDLQVAGIALKKMSQ